MMGISMNSASASALWPQPQSVEYGSMTVTVDGNNFQFVSRESNPPSTLLKAFERYQDIIFNLQNMKKKMTMRSSKKGDSDIHWDSYSSLDTLEVSLASNSEELNEGTDESYSLRVEAGVSILKAQTVYGALRGLETFSQLVQPGLEGFMVESTPVIIQDSPRFPWRGILVDTSRHYFPVDKILNILDAMSYNKMNVFHWHVIDADSFPIVSKVYPEFSAMGAYAPDAVYNQDEITYIIEYARLRGIRVMIEFDIPGHSSFGYSHPELVGCPEYYNHPYIYQKQSVALDPTLNATYEMLGNFLREMSYLFPDQYMHLGGDEVRHDCWEQKPSIKTFMDANGIATYADLERYFWGRLSQEVLAYIPKTFVLWDEVLVNRVPYPKGTLLHVWQKENYLVDAVRAGNRVIRSQGWYLDQAVPGGTRYRWLETWLDFYELEPIPSALTPQEGLNVLGGLAAMWTEQVDQMTFDPIVWPRASAVAERLWSSKDLRNSTEAGYRLMDHRCRMHLRGIDASPIFPDYCEREEDITKGTDNFDSNIGDYDVFFPSDKSPEFIISPYTESLIFSFLLGVAFTATVVIIYLGVKSHRNPPTYYRLQVQKI